MVKKASIIALVFIALALIACAVILFIMLGSSAAENGVPGLAVKPVKENNQDLVAVLIVIGVLLFIILLAILMSYRDKLKKWKS